MLGYSDRYVNVVGDAEEPICDYRTCRHRLSEHGRQVVSVDALIQVIRRLE